MSTKQEEETKPEDEACRYCISHGVTTLADAIKAKVVARPKITCVRKPGIDTCTFCKYHKKACEDMPAAMRGDVYDLFALLQWGDLVLSHCVTHKPTFSWTTIQANEILTLMHTLLRTLAQDVQIAHRKELNIGMGIRERRDTGFQLAYDLFVAQRQATLTNPAPDDLAPLRTPQQYPRLKYGDRGFLKWSTAKMDFGNGMFDLIDKKTEDAAKRKMLKGWIPRSVTVFS